MILLALAATASFDPLAFFAGRTEGRATLRIALHRRRAVRVHGVGTPQPDGSLILDQQVEQEGKPATSRRWHLSRVGPGRYAGTLTDAVGPVTAETVGARLHIRYRTKGKIGIEQWLALGPDGQAADNRLTARKLGVPVARLHETIRRVS
jgi:hypothetical protein